MDAVVTEPVVARLQLTHGIQHLRPQDEVSRQGLLGNSEIQLLKLLQVHTLPARLVQVPLSLVEVLAVVDIGCRHCDGLAVGVDLNGDS